MPTVRADINFAEIGSGEAISPDRIIGRGGDSYPSQRPLEVRSHSPREDERAQSDLASLGEEIDESATNTELDVLEHWLVTHLPPANEPPRVTGALTAVYDLAERYHQTDVPMPGQIRAVDRALRRLAERGLAQRCSTRIGDPCDPSFFWTRRAPGE